MVSSVNRDSICSSVNPNSVRSARLMQTTGNCLLQSIILFSFFCESRKSSAFIESTSFLFLSQQPFQAEREIFPVAIVEVDVFHHGSNLLHVFVGQPKDFFLRHSQVTHYVLPADPGYSETFGEVIRV